MASVSLFSSATLPTHSTVSSHRRVSSPSLPFPRTEALSSLSMLYAVSAAIYCISYPRRPCITHFVKKSSVSTSFSVQASLPENNNGFKVEYTPWMIVGLGNPGNKYHGTRHNAGFEMIDSIVKTQGIVMNTIQSKALLGIVQVPSERYQFWW